MAPEHPSLSGCALLLLSDIHRSVGDPYVVLRATGRARLIHLMPRAAGTHAFHRSFVPVIICKVDQTELHLHIRKQSHRLCQLIGWYPPSQDADPKLLSQQQAKHVSTNAQALLASHFALVLTPFIRPSVRSCFRSAHSFSSLAFRPIRESPSVRPHRDTRHERTPAPHPRQHDRDGQCQC